MTQGDYPQKTLGIIGGGQLGRMLTQAAQKLNIKTIVLDPTPNSPAGKVADEQIVGDYKDAKQIEKLAGLVGFLTFEIESANSQILIKLKKDGIHVEPPGETLEIIQDKLLQKEFLKKNKIAIAPFAKVDSARDITDAAKLLKYPLVLKARFHGYDGRGNATIKNEKQIKTALNKLAAQKLYLEKYIPFKKELATQVVRTARGEIKVYPVVETIQKNNICHVVIAPANIDKKVQVAAEKLAKKTVAGLKGAGVFGVEMFLTKNNEVLVNEIAPRVHNSGHYTIEGAQTSQFEQHIRAVCEMPLGNVEMTAKSAVMVNLLGERNGKASPRGIEKVQNTDGAYIHIYDKSETRIERKMGHITVLGQNPAKTLNLAKKLRKEISI